MTHRAAKDDNYRDRIEKYRNVKPVSTSCIIALFRPFSVINLNV